MTEGIEPVIAERWLQQQLEDRPLLIAEVGGSVPNARLWGHAAPQGEEGEPDYPFVLWSQSATSDLTTLGAERIWSVLEYVVRIVGQVNSWDPLLDAAAEIDAALDQADGTVTGGVVFGCTRVRPFLLPEVRNGVQYRHLGGVYRLLVKGA